MAYICRPVYCMSTRYLLVEAMCLCCGYSRSGIRNSCRNVWRLQGIYRYVIYSLKIHNGKLELPCFEFNVHIHCLFKPALRLVMTGFNENTTSQHNPIIQEKWRTGFKSTTSSRNQVSIDTIVFAEQE